MTPQLAAKLTIHETIGPDGAVAGRFGSSYGSLVPFPAPGISAKDADEHALPSLLRREARRRRLLAFGDLAAAAAALTVVFTMLGGRAPRRSPSSRACRSSSCSSRSPACMTAISSRSCGRPSMRCRRSPSSPGLYALSVTILGPLVFDHALVGERDRRAVGLQLRRHPRRRGSPFAGSTAADRLLERCLVVGDPRPRRSRAREACVQRRALGGHSDAPARGRRHQQAWEPGESAPDRARPPYPPNDHRSDDG